MSGIPEMKLKPQHGVAMVEFAIALPFLLLILLAIGEFGRMLYQYNSLLQAARDAGRYASDKAWDHTLGKIVLVDAYRNYDLRAETKNVAVYGVPKSSGGTGPVVPGLGVGNVDVFVSPANSEHVEVRITFKFSPVVGSSIPAFFGKAIALEVPLVASAVMRAL